MIAARATPLFTVLEMAQGKGIGQCFARHRYHKYLKCLRRLDAEFAVGLKPHLVIENYGTHRLLESRTIYNATTFYPSLHTNQLRLVKFGRTLVWKTYGKIHTELCLRQRRWPCWCYRRISRGLEYKPQTFHLDSNNSINCKKLACCKQALEKIQPACTLPHFRKVKRNNFNCLWDTTLGVAIGLTANSNARAR